jgi:inner membrane protein
MDNLSHSLIGLIAGESIARSGRARESSLAPGTRRGLLVTLSVVGSNLPDLDLVYSWHPFSRSVPAKLDYVLQHRGYTHTIVVCVVLAALLYGAAELWVRWRRLLSSASDRLVLAGTCLFAVGLHLAMDFLNSYGVHPFWPWQNRWFYGDSVFIVEPLYWAAALALFFQVRSMSARVVIGVAPACAAVVCLLLHLVTPLGCAGYALLSIAMLLVGARASAAVAAFTSAGVALAVTLLFVVAGGIAARRIDSLAAAELPAGHVIDHVLSPAPANPLCWDVLLLEIRGDRYTARFGVLSLLPAAVPARQCPRTSGRGSTTALVAPLAAPAHPEIQWLDEFSMSRALLARLTDSHCRAAALMQFARAPFAAALEDRWVMGDLRFDRTRGGGMASIDLGPASEPTGREECHSPVPWVPPRADLLDLRR